MAKRLETESNATNFSWPHFAARRALRKWWNKEIREPLFWRPSSDAIIIGAHPRSSSSLWWSGAVSRACFRCYCSLFFSSTLFRFFCIFIVSFFFGGKGSFASGGKVITQRSGKKCATKVTIARWEKEKLIPIGHLWFIVGQSRGQHNVCVWTRWCIVWGAPSRFISLESRGLIRSPLRLVGPFSFFFWKNFRLMAVLYAAYWLAAIKK